MTFLEAAREALKQTGRPMKPDEMVSMALKKGWLGQVGKTPSATMRAQLGLQVKKSDSIFCRVAPGLFGLKETGRGIQLNLFDDASDGSRNLPKTETKKKKSHVSASTGCVYILSNPSFKSDWLKIGQTSDPEPWARMKELYSTPVPLPFSCVAYMQTRRFVLAEKHIHSFLDRFTHKRISEKREFFRVDQQKAIDTLRDVAAIVGGVVRVGPFSADGDGGKDTVTDSDGITGEWHICRNGVVIAKGVYSDGRLEVLAGSQVNMSKPIGRSALDRLRKRLKADGFLVEKKKGVFVLKRKQLFDSPSAAASFVLGGASNGWHEWTNVNGERLDVMRRK